MSTYLSAREYRDILAFVDGLHGCRNQDALGRYVVRQVPALIGACQTTWNVITPASAVARVEAWPPPPDPSATTGVFARHMLDHPCIVHYLRTGTPRATKISDFLSAAAFGRSTIYSALYRDLGYADQLAIFLTPPGPQVVGLALGRERRSFSERDRAILDLLRGHLLHAHRTTRALARLPAAPDEVGASAWLVTLRPDRRPLELDDPPPAARACLRRHFGPAGRRDGLPTVLERWCALQFIDLKQPAVLHRHNGAHELHVRLLPGSNGAAPALLVAERRLTPPVAPALTALGLSPREAQVLHAVAQGLSNAAVANALGISPGTVRKHLEHVYAKLGVDNRTAAAAIARAAGPPHGIVSPN